MGVLNATPDSFSDGGRYLDPEKAVRRALEMEAEGADMIDVGGESTRPGAEPVSVEEQIRRVLPVIAGIREHATLPISIDTVNSEVARAALEAGADIVNDISCCGDPQMAETVARYGAGFVIMHIQGEPKTMQDNPHYTDVVEEVECCLLRVARSVEAAGVSREQICLDPGIGFGKLLAHNLALIGASGRFRASGYPVLLGMSRKSFIGMLAGGKADDRLEGSLAAAVAGALAGADVLRVHDVAASRKALSVADALRSHLPFRV